MDTRRIVLLGKTGDGRSSTGNLILGEECFLSGSSPNSQTQNCNLETKSINGKKITVVDTPGFFDTEPTSTSIKSEIVQCITECAPGPHAFLITLKVGRYTNHEINIVKEITSTFGEEALKYAVVLFTFGDQLSENETIEDFVEKSNELKILVDKCGGRVHVIDNKNWNKQQDEYRNNSVQVQKLLNTIEKIVKNNGGKCYTNEMLQAVHEAIDEESKVLCEGKEIPDMNMMREQAKQRVHTKLSVRLVGVGTGVIMGAFLGFKAGLSIVMDIVKVALPSQVLKGVAVVTVSSVGAAAGGITGYRAVEGVDNVRDAMKMASKETVESAQNLKENIDEFLSDVNPTDYHKFKQN